MLHTSLVIFAVAAVRAYQVLLSPFAGGACRFQPTCSEYAAEALTIHGFFRGGWLALKRFARCHPLGPAGWDAVPAPDSSTGTNERRLDRHQRA
ncbi:MAG: membrane protein insertion efficiency factor YidD [Luteitalea sp.]|nr:membrane protein insertion efficiency factor YidD [Luteitalea sp.]